jgi:hypothetical protein
MKFLTNNITFWRYLFPIGAGLWIALWTALTLWYRRKTFGSQEAHITELVAAGTAWIFYVVLFQDAITKLMGKYIMIGLLIVGGCVCLVGAWLWLKSGRILSN